MKLGFLTAPFPETPLMEVADWAAANGFEILEIACWPRATGPTRRYAGTSHIDVANLSASQATRDRRRDRGQGPGHLRASASTPTRSTRTRPTGTTVIGHLKQVIVAAEKMGVPLVNTFMGGDAREEPGPELGGGARGSGRTSSPSPRTTGARSRSRTARCSSATTSGRAATTSPPRRACGAGSWSSGAARSGSTSTRRTWSSR